MMTRQSYRSHDDWRHDADLRAQNSGGATKADIAAWMREHEERQRRRVRWLLVAGAFVFAFLASLVQL
jgi:uncharacterized protein (DUF934 family)